ncbi:LysR family transcriptional regulator [Glaciimonas sp. CA11.2]|uniref:LysR family transcriptional regulator n=1 Tax=unclassified Glaciimonas TaxID=2644401 RepID=UPI002AB4BD9F|nr:MULTISPECIES: LysR family transcriptional regulator [unclassified Glaciimonas]MDY7547742.1 LysR family transcriptional regulator [Glaciimonas sp. CA11.2]MEB0014407.1 LysR family transcriptional regulator [Glaciimonas sp. Cout2]MEB0082891.1 LysR family transcriptional regulator [Glaciimonas sp. Gout2]MEB0162686.1 LysR family transcriptional regulator [Glaciimonas sp. CA11.2]
MFDWQDLYVFTVLARTESLSAAARELGIEHATVGRRLESLEKALGLRLVDKLPRSRPLTQDGRAIATLAQNMTQVAGLIEQRARPALIGLAGSVRVSAPPSLSRACIVPRIAALRASHPQLRLILQPSTTLAALGSGEADIAIRTVRPEDGDLVRKKVGEVHFGLYGTREFSRRPAEQWTFISYDESLDHLPQQIWLHQVRAGRPIAFFASDLMSQQMAARDHVGAVVLPTMVGEDDPELVPLPTPETAPARDIWIIVYPDVRRSPLVEVVMDFLVDCIAREPRLAMSVRPK